MTTIENLSCLKGKTIENVTANLNEDGNAKSFILYFTDGKELEFCANVNKYGDIEPEIVVENI